MRIDTTNRVSSPGTPGARRARGAGGERFSLDNETAPVRVANAGGPAAAEGIESLIALQGVDDPLLARRKTVRRGHALLDALEAIKLDLLSGAVGEGRLNRIMALIGQAREDADPTLTAIIDDIELRAKVELAKLGVW